MRPVRIGRLMVVLVRVGWVRMRRSPNRWQITSVLAVRSCGQERRVRPDLAARGATRRVGAVDPAGRLPRVGRCARGWALDHVADRPDSRTQQRTRNMDRLAGHRLGWRKWCEGRSTSLRWRGLYAGDP